MSDILERARRAEEEIERLSAAGDEANKLYLKMSNPDVVGAVWHPPPRAWQNEP